MIRLLAIILLCTALGGCWSSVINAYSGQDTTLRGNAILVEPPANVPVQPDGGGGGAG
jgi:hypothetical protein